MEELWITPRTDAELTIIVKQGGTLRDDATVTASVFSPRGGAVTTDAALTPRSGGTGEYVLPILATWSEASGRAVEGEFVVQVKALRAGAQTITRFRYNVRFNDDN